MVAQGKYGEAIALFRQAIAEIQQAVGPDSAELIFPLQELGRALWRNGEKGEAQMTLAHVAHLTRKAFENPTLPKPATRTLFKVGCQDEWLLYQGDFETAAEGLRATIQFEESEKRHMEDPEDMPVWETLAEVEEALGHHDAARKAYLQAADQWEQRLSPGHPRALRCRECAAALQRSAA